MSAKFSADEVRAMAAVYQVGRVYGALTAYANRIEADESAEPVYFCYDNGHWDLATKAWYDSWPAEKTKKLFAHPPAQTSEIPCSLSEALNVIERWGMRDNTLDGDDAARFRTVADKIAPAPSSPYAADSGRGNTPIAELMAEYTEEGCDFTNMTWVRKTALRYVETMPDKQTRCLLYALAAQGHGEAVAEVYEYPRDHREPILTMLTGIHFTGMPLPIGTKLYAAPPASLAGVPDVHGWSLKVQRSDLDGELGIWAVAPGCATWIAAAPSAPEFTQQNCFCDRMYPDSDPGASCGDCPTRDYKAIQPVQAVDVGAIREVIAELTRRANTGFNTNDRARCGHWATQLTRAITKP